MKFSVLLPTRNRLDLLSRAIETVRRQDYDDWEIIVSDNYSEENIADYILSLGDERIKYFRTDSFIPVTDNWNNAIEKSDGDYVIMLGDDDGLMTGYFSTLIGLIEKFNSPDFIYTNAFLYAYPGVLPGVPEGFLRTYSRREIFQSTHDPFWLDKNKAIKFVQSSLDFRVTFDYNMQFSLVSRKIIEEMKQYGSFYQSPYPDYYASNAIMFKAERILVVPIPLVIIGISPKSFGYYYFNDAESDGNAFLKNIPDQALVSRLQNVILPGTDMNTSWLISMETLAEKFRLNVQYSRYRYIQACVVYAGVTLRKDKAKQVYLQLKKKLTVGERVRYTILFSLLSKVVFGSYRSALSQYILSSAGSHPACYMPNLKGKFNTILEVFERVNPNKYEELEP